MINFFLRIKHWQLFLLIYGVPFALQFVWMGIVFPDILAQPNPNPEHIFDRMWTLFAVILPFTGLFFAWLWALGKGVQQSIPEGIRLSFGRFRLFFWVMVIAMFGLIWWMLDFMTNIASLAMEGNDPGFEIFRFIGVILFMEFILIAITIYCYWFVAKSYKMAELQRRVKFDDYIGEFFLIMFFFIGVWILQPKINRFFENGPSVQDKDSDSLLSD